MSSGAKKHIRDNTICQCTVAQLYLVTPECSARESFDNIGLLSLGLTVFVLDQIYSVFWVDYKALSVSCVKYDYIGIDITRLMEDCYSLMGLKVNVN